MRILYVCADRGIPVGGVKGAAAHVRGLVEALRRLGHRVQVIAGSAEGEESPNVPVIEIPRSETSVSLERIAEPRAGRAFRHLWTNLELEAVLAEQLEAFRPDLVYERYSPFGAAGPLLCARRGVPHTLEVNAPLAWEGARYRGQVLTEAAGILERAALSAAAQVVVVSEELRSTLIEGGADPSRIVVVPNGVDTEMFSPDGEAAARDAGDRVVVGFVGSLKPWHGIDVLAEGFRQLAGRGPYDLLVVGTGPEARRIRDLQEEFPGRISHVEAVAHREVPRYLRAMDVAVAPYPALEPFYFSPLKVLEYMAAGLPVVASAIGQIAALIDPGKTGILVAPGDPRSLAEAVAGLGAHPDRRRRIGEAAAAEVRRAHQWVHRARQILDRAQRAA